MSKTAKRSKNVRVENLKVRKTLFSRLRAYFLAGVLVTAPAVLTLYMAWMFISFVDAQVGSILPPKYSPSTYLNFDVPGFGLLVLIVFLTILGAVTAGFIGKILIRFGENALNRMPIIRSVYTTLKQLFETVLSDKTSAFQQCVLVEYPRRGIWALGFISGVTEGEVQSLTESKVVNVFIPTTPNPTSGFLLFVPSEDVVVLSMTAEEGIKMVISGGIVAPPDRRPKENRRVKIQSIDHTCEHNDDRSVELDNDEVSSPNAMLQPQNLEKTNIEES